MLFFPIAAYVSFNAQIATGDVNARLYWKPVLVNYHINDFKHLNGNFNIGKPYINVGQFIF